VEEEIFWVCMATKQGHSRQSFEICAHISLRVLVQGSTKLLLWFSLMDEEYEEIQTSTTKALFDYLCFFNTRHIEYCGI
jgi:hypothetical protein